MKNILKILLILITININAQETNTVEETLKRSFSELCSRQNYSSLHNYISECNTDNSEVGGEDVTDVTEWQELMKFKYGPCNSVFEGYWFRSYSIISHANNILASDFNSDLKELYFAEAKFLRALAYFNLVTVFGGVPIYNDSMKISSTSMYTDYSTNFVFKKRNTISEVFGLIESDLKEAVNSLPQKSQLTQDNIYFATSGAAKALLAKMYLFQSSYAKNYASDNRFSGLSQRWEKALQYAEEVINSGEYSLVGANGETYYTWWDNSYLYNSTTGFRYMFSKEGNDNRESVFEVRRLYDENYGWLSFTENSISQYTTSRYVFVNGQKRSFRGWGFMTPTQDLIKEYASESGNAKNDPRFQVTIGIEGDMALDKDQNWKEIHVESTPTGAVFRKYESYPNQSFSYYNGDINIKVIRYSDVLLWAAEAALELGDQHKALTYINIVRSRARNCGNTGFPKDLTSVTFNDIVRERRLELALEGHRFFDLVRWNLATTKLNGRFNESYQENIVFTPGVNEFFPIPGSVMEHAKGVVEQNNGYEQLCARLDPIRDIFIKTNASPSVIDLDGKYSSNIFEEPTFTITLSNPSFAQAEIRNRKLNINYNTLSDGDTTQLTIKMIYGNSQSLETSFIIRALEPLFTATDDKINKLYRHRMYDYEILPFYADYGLDTKATRVIAFNFNNSMDNYNLIFGNRNDPEIGLSIGISKNAFHELVKKENKKANDIIPLLVVLRNRTLNKYYGIDVPIKVSDIIPFISITRPQIAGEEISFDLSTTKLINDYNSLFTYSYSYSTKRRGIRANINYDPEKLKYIGYELDGSFIEQYNHNIIAEDSSGYLEISDYLDRTMIGEGKLITLRFKDLGNGLGTITANNFGYLLWQESDYPGDLNNVFLSYPDYTNIIVANELIGLPDDQNTVKKALIQLYPNPAVSHVSVKAEFENYSVSLYSTDGRLLGTSNSESATTTIPVSHLNKGIYFLKVNNNGEIQNLKFIKK